MRKCEKHNIDLKCLGGCSAHKSNWVCPECIKEEIDIKPKDESYIGTNKYRDIDGTLK